MAARHPAMTACVLNVKLLDSVIWGDADAPLGNRLFLGCHKNIVDDWDVLGLRRTGRPTPKPTCFRGRSTSSSKPNPDHSEMYRI